MSEVPVSFSGVTAGYGGAPVLRDISLELRDGDFLAVIGPNGGGKTTLLRVALGLLEPMEGETKVFGESPAKGAHRLGYVPQHGTFDRRYPIKAEEAVMTGLRDASRGFQLRYTEEEKESAERAIEMAGIGPFRGKRIGDLSGGQLQRVLIARALAGSPEAILLDEPTASLDPEMSSKVYEILRNINSKGIAVMLVTHDLDAMSQGVKRVACVNGRAIIGESPEITPEMFELGYGIRLGRESR